MLGAYFLDPGGQADAYFCGGTPSVVGLLVADEVWGEDLDQRVNMQEELPGICRSLLKAGDDFEEIEEVF